MDERYNFNSRVILNICRVDDFLVFLDNHRAIFEYNLLTQSENCAVVCDSEPVFITKSKYLFIIESGIRVFKKSLKNCVRAVNADEKCVDYEYFNNNLVYLAHEYIRISDGIFPLENGLACFKTSVNQYDGILAVEGDSTISFISYAQKNDY